MESHCYIILYDLCSPGRDYQGLYQAIKRYEHWGKLTESAWAIVSTQDHAEIRNNLMNYIDTNDRLLVIQSGRSAAWTKAIASNEWLKTNLIR